MFRNRTNFFIILLASLFKLFIFDDQPQHYLLNLDNEARNELKANQTDFYVIKSFENPSNKDMLVRLFPRNDEEHMYDPDLFLSTRSQYPSIFQYEYGSERIGEDLISLPARVFAGKDIYIAVYCANKCKYTLFAQFKETLPIYSNQLVSLDLKKDNTFYFKYYHNESSAEHIEFLSFTNSYSSRYKMFVSKNIVPNQQNTLEVNPFIFGGYSVIIEKNSINYCINCTYQIMLETDHSAADVKLLVRTSTTLTRLTKNNPHLGVTLEGKRSCFIYNLNKKDQDENIIVTTNVYTGNGTIVANPWSLPTDQKDFLISYNLDDFEVFRILPAMRNIMSQSFGEIYFCVYAQKTTSYFINVYLEKDVEKNQDRNVLIAGLTAVGFLPAKNISSYKLQYYGGEPSLSVSLSKNAGNPVLHGFICQERKCEFNVQKMRNNTYKTMNSLKFGDKQILNIRQEENRCYNQEPTSCRIFAVVVCEGEVECIYQVSYIHEKSQLTLLESSPYHHMVANNQYDYYKFYVSNDQNIEKITITLSSLTGNSELYASKSNEFPSKRSNFKSANNTVYTPDVITFTKQDGNLTGFFYVSVFGASDSYYSLYYYIEYKDKDMLNPTYLYDGYIVKDYFDTNKNDFKFFVFTTRSYPTASHLGVTISLTYETLEYDLYVYNDKNLVFYNEKTNKMENYLWKSEEGQVTIEPSDKKFSPSANYYIAVVLKDYYYNLDFKTTMGKFYISAFFQGSPMILSEGITNMFTLHEKNQTYIYLLNNLTNDVFISLDTFFGDVQLYANLAKPISKLSDAKYKANHKILQNVRIKTNELEACKKFFFCVIHILVEKKQSGSQFTLNVDSSSDKPVLFKNGVSKNYQVLPTETKYYYTTIHGSDTGVINIDFKHGRATVYGKIISDQDDLKKFQHDWPKPNRFNSNLKVNANAIGYSVTLDKELVSKCDPCIVLFSVTGNELNYQDLDIIYSISFVTSAMRIAMNHPYKAYIGAKEYNYYVFHFPKNISTLYVQLTNVQGDSDLVMNYGTELPTLDKYHWRSASSYTDIIDIDNSDTFFTNREMNSMQGTYTVGVVGYTPSSYVIYVTSHAKKVQYIRNDVSASCMTKVKGEWCYFRYETGFLKNDRGQDLEREHLLLNTEYAFGTGIIYAKVFNTTSDEDVFEQLPTSQNFEWSSQQQNRRNYLFMEVYKNMLLKKHGVLDILVGVYCVERCFFTITPALQFTNYEKYIEHGRENLLYMEAGRNVTLKYFNSKHSDLLFEINCFSGDAELEIYENLNGALALESVLSKRMEINDNSTVQHFDFKPALKYQQGDQCFVNTKITSRKPTGMFLKIEDQTQLKRFKVGTANALIFMGPIKSVSGYFEVLEEYESININLAPSFISRVESANMKIFAKLKIVDKNKFYDDAKADVPYEDDFDYRDEYDPVLRKFSMKLPGVKFEEEAKNGRSKIAVYLITIKIYDIKSNLPLFDLSIIPQINYVTRFSLLPGKAIYSSIDVGQGKYHLYDVGKFKEKNNVLKLEISQCSGKIQFHFSNQVNYLDIDAVHTVQNIEYKNGKYQVVLENIEANYFLTVVGESGHPKLPKCYWNMAKKYMCIPSEGTVADYMVYFESFEKDNYFTHEPRNQGIIEFDLTSSDSARISWGNVLKKYMLGSEISTENADALYSIYMTDDEEISKTMQSLCSMEYSERIIKIAANLTNTFYDITGLQRNRKYFINVVGNVKGSNGVSYIPIEIEMKASLSWIIYVILFVVICGVGGVAIYFFRKLKRTEKILELETGRKSDAFVGNLSITEMSSQRNLRYGTLVEELGGATQTKDEALDK